MGRPIFFPLDITKNLKLYNHMYRPRYLNFVLGYDVKYLNFYQCMSQAKVRHAGQCVFKLKTPLVYLLHQKAGLLAFGVNHPFDESKHNIMVHYKNCACRYNFSCSRTDFLINTFT